MGITLFSFGGVFGPLHAVAGWFAHRAGRAKHLPHGRQATSHHQGARACVSWPAPSAQPRGRAERPLRVVRVVDSAGAPAGAGRMFMSGRMADVCAELDRLAALEAR